MSSTIRQPGSELPTAFVELMERFVSPISARAIVRSAIAKVRRSGENSDDAILRQLERSTHILIPPGRRDEVKEIFRSARAAAEPATPPAGSPRQAQREPRARRASQVGREPRRSEPRPRPEPPPRPSPAGGGGEPEDQAVVEIRRESDLNAARMYARESCKLVGVRGYPAQKVVTAISELARNIACYAGCGRLYFHIDTEVEALSVVAEDEGPGIDNLDEIFAGAYRSKTGLGRGLIGVKKLADEFEIETSPAGTRVRISFSYGGRR